MRGQHHAAQIEESFAEIQTIVRTSAGHIIWKWAMTDEYLNSHRGYAASPHMEAESCFPVPLWFNISKYTLFGNSQHIIY